jgi:hypothetical protein
LRTRLALTGRGLRLAELALLTDVDTWTAATQVAATIPDSNFARSVLP